MRIEELLENKTYKIDEFSPDKNKYGLDFDLVEDMTYFMNNDDDTYRRHVYPAVIKCIKKIKSGNRVDPSIFEEAASECYKDYMKKYPIRQLPDMLDEELTFNICEKMYKEVCQHVEDGKL